MSAVDKSYFYQQRLYLIENSIPQRGSEKNVQVIQYPLVPSCVYPAAYQIFQLLPIFHELLVSIRRENNPEVPINRIHKDSEMLLSGFLCFSRQEPIIGSLQLVALLPGDMVQQAIQPFVGAEQPPLNTCPPEPIKFAGVLHHCLRKNCFTDNVFVNWVGVRFSCLPLRIFLAVAELIKQGCQRLIHILSAVDVFFVVIFGFSEEHFTDKINL